MVKKIYGGNQVVYGRTRLPGPKPPKEPEAYEYIGEDGHRIVRSIHHPDIYVEDLAFLLMTQRWPASRMEHIDGDPLNCKWDNLRESGEGKPRSFELPGRENRRD